MKIPVHTLTADQAAEELELLMDERFLVEDKPAEFHHWKTENAQRVVDLEAWFLMHQKDEMPAAALKAQDAPPHHLQPEPVPGPAATKEKPMPSPSTSPDPVAERLAGLLTKFNDLALQVPNAPNGKACVKIRQTMHNTKFAIRSLCNRNGLAVPELPEIPPNPFSEVPPPAAPIAKKPEPEPTVDQVEEEHEERTSTLPPVEDLSEKAGPGPYKEPTTEQIIQAAEAHRASLGLPMEPRSCSTADLDQRDRFLVNVKVDLTDELRQLMADADAMLPPWLRQVQAELARARAKFPSPDHLTLALAEESGEVVKAMLDLRAGKGTLQELHAEIIQTMAMCVRLLEEGDPAVLGEAVA